MNRKMLMAGMLVACAFSVGCAGQGAREHVLSPATALVWPYVKDDADIGIQAQQDAEFMTKISKPVIGPGVAASKQERLKNFDEAVQLLSK